MAVVFTPRRLVTATTLTHSAGNTQLEILINYLLGASQFVRNMVILSVLKERFYSHSRVEQTGSKRLTDTESGNQVGEPVFCLPPKVSTSPYDGYAL